MGKRLNCYNEPSFWDTISPETWENVVACTRSAAMNVDLKNLMELYDYEW